jgi:hypothetical protein
VLDFAGDRELWLVRWLSYRRYRNRSCSCGKSKACLVVGELEQQQHRHLRPILGAISWIGWSAGRSDGFTPVWSPPGAGAFTFAFTGMALSTAVAEN